MYSPAIPSPTIHPRYNPLMELAGHEAMKMLADARSKAERLLAEMLRMEKEVEANPPNLPPGQLEQGRAAFQKAVDAARRTLASLDAAEEIAVNDLHQDRPSQDQL